MHEIFFANLFVSLGSLNAIEDVSNINGLGAVVVCCLGRYLICLWNTLLILITFY